MREKTDSAESPTNLTLAGLPSLAASKSEAVGYNTILLQVSEIPRPQYKYTYVYIWFSVERPGPLNPNPKTNPQPHHRGGGGSS